MIPRPQLATFSLLLLLTAFFVLRPLRANDERAANQLLAESLLADNSASLPQAGQLGHLPLCLCKPIEQRLGGREGRGKMGLPRQDRYHVHPPKVLRSLPISRRVGAREGRRELGLHGQKR